MSEGGGRGCADAIYQPGALYWSTVLGAAVGPWVWLLESSARAVVGLPIQ